MHKNATGSSSLRKPVSTAVLKQPAIVVNRLTPDVMKNKTEWLISEDYSILQVIQDQQSVPSSQKIPKPAHIPNWDMAADAVNSVSRVYRSASCCKSQLENVILLREGEISYDNNTKKTKGIYKTKNNRPMKTSHLYQQDNNGTYTSIFLKRSKAMFKLAQKRKALAESVKNKKKILKIPKGQSYLNDYGIKYNNPRTPMEIANSCQERIQRKQQKNQTVGVVTATPSLPGMLHTPTTLPSTMLTTSNVLKGTPAVAVGQQQTAAIPQQMATSSARISGQHAVTLAVPAIVTQAQEQQVMIQVQPSAHFFLVTPQAQVTMLQMQIQQLSQNASTTNIDPPVAVQQQKVSPYTMRFYNQQK